MRPVRYLPDRIVRLTVLTLGFSAVAGCSDAAPPADARVMPPATVRDSAGVVIVEHGHPADLPLLTLAPEPSLSIGALDSEGPDQLHEVLGTFARADGSVVILNAGTSEVRVFGPDGGFLWSAGGQGEGPGEFSSPMEVRPMPGDSVVVWDGELQRLTVLGPDGNVARMVRPEVPTPSPVSMAAVAAGGFVVVGLIVDVQPDRFVPQRLDLFRLRADGAVVDTLPSMTYIEWALLELEGRGRRLSDRLFGWRASMALDAEGYWAGRGDRAELVRRDWEGDVTTVSRWTAADRPVSDADAAGMIEAHVESSSDDIRPVLRRFLQDLEREERMPEHDLAVPTGNGGALVRLFTPPRDPGRAPWLVVEPSGHLRARLALPERFRPFQLGDGWVLGVETDELDVERVRRYALVGGDGA